ncbi:tetraspanin-18-like isoform X1 [Neopsephotus bourkii]|uniref:tetraspanin-18-like isoform X1 n=1 Tax=Neopsephotus bourkii TaxID=309878 RepID=UPI002AA51051|nr:tetraspanin-18-like isoform X1 [Neopsephotus bourkii]
MGVLSCVKYLMLIFNALVFAGGTSLVAVGLWVAVDPSGFQHIVAANGVLSAGAFLLLAVGTALALLGFLGCCGALRRSRALLLVFFILVSLVFVTQLVGAVLFLLHWKQMQPELLLSELRRSYRGDEGAEVFSTAWNTLMVTFSCCGVLGPEDFGNGSCFQELHPGMPWPRVCCTRDGLLQAGELLGWEQCQDRSPGYIHAQGCFTAFGRALQQFLSLPGICSLVVLGIEIFAMFFAFCLYYNFD